MDRAEDEPALAFRVNGEAPVVHFSTDYVMSSGDGERPWREDDATDPLSFYGMQGEKALCAAGDQHLIVPELVGLSSHLDEFPADHRAAGCGA